MLQLAQPAQAVPPAVPAPPVRPSISTLADNLANPDWRESCRQGARHAFGLALVVLVVLSALGHMPMLQTAGVLHSSSSPLACNASRPGNTSCCWVLTDTTAQAGNASSHPNRTASNGTASAGNAAAGAGAANGTTGRASNSSEAPPSSAASNASAGAGAANGTTKRASNSTDAPPSPAASNATAAAAILDLVKNLTTQMPTNLTGVLQMGSAIVEGIGNAANPISQVVSALSSVMHKVIDRVARWVRAGTGFAWWQRTALCAFLLFAHHLAWYLLLQALESRNQSFAFDPRHVVVSVFWWASWAEYLSYFLGAATGVLLMVPGWGTPWAGFDLVVCIIHVVTFLVFFSFQYYILCKFSPTDARLANNVERFVQEEVTRAQHAAVLFAVGAALFILTGKLVVPKGVYSCSLLRFDATHDRAVVTCFLLCIGACNSWFVGRRMAPVAVSAAAVSGPELLERQTRFCKWWRWHTILGYVTMSAHAAYNLVTFLLQDAGGGPHISISTVSVADTWCLGVAVSLLAARLVCGWKALRRVTAFAPPPALGTVQNALQSVVGGAMSLFDSVWPGAQHQHAE